MPSAQLTNIPLVVPGNAGLNKQAETSVLGPEWATVANNAVFDSSGRLAARQGWKNITVTPMAGTPAVGTIFEQISTVGGSVIVSAAGNKLWLGTAAPTDITGTATASVGDNWQFVNFGGAVYGFQQGEQPIVRTAGTFADLTVASGTAPQGDCAIVHSGRIWATHSDKQTIKYCALLDATNWLTGAGFIDMTSAWPENIDDITAMAMYNGLMVVFGKSRIVIFGDGQGSALGIDPAQIYVVDTIVGVGCIARDSVQQVEGGDILFLSRQGIQSLSRLIQEKSNPINNVTKNVRDYMVNYLGGENRPNIKSVYSPENGFYLLSLPNARVTFCVDTTAKMQDGAYRVTEWSSVVPTGFLQAVDGTLYFSTSTAAGRIGVYDGYTDNDLPFTFDFASGWLDLGQGAPFIKMIKNIVAQVWIGGDAAATLKWDYDFEDLFNSQAFALKGPTLAEWGTAEWGLAEWGSGLFLRKVDAPADGAGQYIRVGVSASIFGGSFAIQSVGMYTKIGRLSK